MRRPLFYPDERVDLLDFVDAVLHGVVEQSRQNAALLVPPADPTGYAFQGGILAVHGAGTGVSATLNDLRALLTEARDGELYHGRICQDELAAGTVVLLTGGFTPPPAGVATYDVYLRHVYDPSTPEQRVFWDDTLGVEVALPVNTQGAPTYTLHAVVTGAPNPYPAEAMLLGTCTTNGGGAVVSVVQQQRYFFEGSVAAAYASTWGGGLDRDPNRQVNGIHDMHTFVQFVRAQIKEIFGPTLPPWAAVTGNLPSLESLLAEHWEQGAAAPYTQHHKSLTIASAGDPYLLMLSNAGGTTAQALWDISESILDLTRLGVTRGVSFVLPSATTDPGLIIGYIGADLGAGEEAHLRFGRRNPAATWKSSRDWAIVSRGTAALDSDRLLVFEVGDDGAPAAPVAILRLYAGLATMSTQAGAAGDWGYYAAKAMHRSVSVTAFTPCTQQIAVGNPLLIRGEDAFGGGAIARGIWGLSQAAGGPAWHVLQPDRQDITAGTLSVERLEAPLDWLPNATLIPGAPAQVGIQVTTDAAWTSLLAVAIMRRVTNAIPGSTDEVVAYAIIDPTAPGAGDLRWRFGTWVTVNYNPATGIVLNGTQSYYLVIQGHVAGAGGLGPVGEEIRISGLSIPLAHTILRH